MLRKSKRKAVNYLFSILGIILFIFGSLFEYAYPNFVAFYVLVLSIIPVWKSRHNCVFFILFFCLAYSNYSIAFSEYIVIKQNTMFTTYAGTQTAAVGIYIMLLFWSVVLLILPETIHPFSSSRSKEYWRTERKTNVHFVYAIILNLILIFIWVFGFTRPTEIGERGAPSTIYEYSVIIFVLVYYFAGKFKSIRVSTSIILIMYALQNFLYGGRITGLQVLIVFYLMCMEEKYSIKKIIPYIVVLFVIFVFLGAYRGNWSRTGFSLSNIWEILKNSLFTLDTAYSSYHTSLTFILFDSIASIDLKITVFLNFVKAIVLGGYGTPDNSVAHLTGLYYRHYNGGVLPFFFYFFMKWIGVVLISIYVGIIIRILKKVNKKENGANKKENGLKKCLSIYIVASSFRWYLYSPIQITRGILLLALAYQLSAVLIRVLQKKT